MADPIFTNEQAVAAGYPNLATYRLRQRQAEARKARDEEIRERDRRVAERLKRLRGDTDGGDG